MTKLTFVSCNCQGLGDFHKRKDVFQYLREKKYDVYFLQDTHFDVKQNLQIRSEWGYESFFASYNTQSRGVAILFNNTFDFKAKVIDSDPQGNFIILNLKTFEEKFTLINIYGPNRDNPDFYLKVKQKIIDLNLTNIVWGGDWNLVLNPNLDLDNYRNVNNPKAQETVLEVMDEFNLADIWREINPELLQYTWRRARPVLQQSRLDFFLISETLIHVIKDSKILYGYRSDHSFVAVEFEFKKEEKKRNYWKFNSSLLKDHKCVKEIKETITKTKQQYMAPVYNLEQLDNIPDTELQLTISDQLFLDVLLMEVRNTAIGYSVRKKKDDAGLEIQLEREITDLDKKENITEEDLELKILKENNLREIREAKINGIILRTKVRWAAQGEKVTKYFCNLEKRHFISKQMFKLINKNGEEIRDTKEMINETKEFYEQLYKKRKVSDVNIEEIVTTLPKLEEEQANTLEGKITYEEAANALKNMKNDKSPGTDGMTVNFFKFFWKDIGQFIIRSLNEGFENGKMSITQREGIITCIPKGDKPREYLKNWRPISLLNVVYKIGSSCIANRIKNVLPTLIHEDQTGFVPGRYIGDNLRLLYDIIHYLKEENLQGLLVSIDFEKAFDSVDWGFMEKVLKQFGFGKDIIQWVSAFYKDIKSSIIVNGQASSSFNIERGCRQGDPISPYLFILCAEVLACRIREDDNIKGIKIDDTEFKISQFADDTTSLLNGDRHSFEQLFRQLDYFGEISGLKLNAEKTNNVWLGNKRNSDIRWLPHLDMNWNPPKFKILGLWFTCNLEKMEKLNTYDKYLETKVLFNCWAKRSTTPIGKVVVLKSLILSKLIYLWIMLPNPPDDLIDELQKKCFDFVWQGKKDKIKRSTSVYHTKMGGMNIPDIKAYINSLKLTWIRRLFNESSGKWKVILMKKIPEIMNLKKYGTDLLERKKVNPFWNDVFKAYGKLSSNYTPKTPEELLAEPLFFNKHFKIAKKTFTFPDWLTRDIATVGALVNRDGSFKSFDEFTQEYNFNPKYLDYFGCISTIKEYAKKHSIEIKTNKAFCESKVNIILTGALKGAKPIYNAILGEKDKSNVCKKWEEILGKEIDWNKIFIVVNNIKESKLKWFQLRICYRVLVTNSILTHMNITESNKCNFCQSEKDTIPHYLWECQHVQRFWNALINILKEKCVHCERLTLNATLVLFGKDNKIKTDDCFQHILLTAKYYVYKCRFNKVKPSIDFFINNELKLMYKIDKDVHYLEMNIEKFNRKWLLYANIVD